MAKKSELDEFTADFNAALACMRETVHRCCEILPISSVMAALGETIVETADALMTTEQEMQGTTATSLLAARDLLQIIARQIELRAAVLIMDPDANNQVH